MSFDIINVFIVSKPCECREDKYVVMSYLIIWSDNYIYRNTYDPKENSEIRKLRNWNFMYDFYAFYLLFYFEG